jgi:bifunctional DNA-binding transcriptional regulator/antitoxin component of YhaV-PrlF toxin-antitoxin module
MLKLPLIKMATRMRIQKTKNEQYIVTIPKAFAETFDYKQGTVVEFKINEKGEFILKKIK